MTADFTFKETQGASGFNYWIKGVGNLYPDDECTDEKLALIQAAPELLEALSYWLPFIQGQEGKSDESDIMVDKATAAIAKAMGSK